jgi:hypothetical protein
MQVGGDDRQQHPMRFVHPARRCDDVVFGESVHDIADRHIVLQHPRRIEPHDELAILAADDADAVGAVDSMKAWHQVVVRDVGQFGQTADRRAHADIDDRKRAGRQQHGVNGSIGGQQRSRMSDRGAQRLEADHGIGVFAESDVDFCAAAGGGRSHQRHPRDSVGGFFERAGHRCEHLLGGQVAAVGQNRRASKNDLGKHGARNSRRQDHSKRAGREHRNQRERRVAARHCAPPSTRTLSLSDSA